MSWIATAVIAVSTIYQVKEQRKAQKKARKQALEDEAQSIKAATFAETEGEGLGNLGKVSLAVDEDITDLEKLRKTGSTKAVL